MIKNTQEEQFIKKAYEKFKSADDYNRLRLGDVATELLEICYLIEKLPSSLLQTEISLKTSNLRNRIIDNLEKKEQNYERTK